jgi:hypothetical protein
MRFCERYDPIQLLRRKTVFGILVDPQLEVQHFFLAQVASAIDELLGRTTGFGDMEMGRHLYSVWPDETEGGHPRKLSFEFG